MYYRTLNQPRILAQFVNICVPLIAIIVKWENYHRKILKYLFLWNNIYILWSKLTNDFRISKNFNCDQIFVIELYWWCMIYYLLYLCYKFTCIHEDELSYLERKELKEEIKNASIMLMLCLHIKSSTRFERRWILTYPNIILYDRS